MHEGRNKCYAVTDAITVTTSLPWPVDTVAVDVIFGSQFIRLS